MGVFSLITCFCCGAFGIPFPLIALGLGAFSLVRQNKEPEKYGGKPFAIAGVAIGVISLILTIVMLVIGVGANVMQRM